MTQAWYLIFCAAALIATALVAGIFMAFSDFGMKSLGAVAPAGGIESMQIINRDVYGSIFIKLLVGVAPYGVVLAALGYFQSTASAAAWVTAGTVIYLVGVMFVTIKFNVPMNQKLDAMDHTAVETIAYWRTYLKEWTYWNHIRTFASGAAAVCFLVACVEIARQL